LAAQNVSLKKSKFHSGINDIHINLHNLSYEYINFCLVSDTSEVLLLQTMSNYVWYHLVGTWSSNAWSII